MHFSQTMVPLQFCYQFYACLVLTSVFGGVAAFCLALMTVYGIGGAELVALSFVSFFGMFRLFLPPSWGSSADDPYSCFASDEIQIKDLAVDTFVLQENEEMISACSCCPICLHTFETGDEVMIATVCHHAYHSNCLEKWLPKSATCPYCRQDLEVRCLNEMNASDNVRKPGAWGIFEGIFDSIYA